MFKKIKQNKIYQDAWLEFFQDEIEFPDGSLGTYAWVKRKNGIAVVLITDAREILLQKEYRYVTKGYSWEIPGGGIDQGEDPEESAVRELQEETGIELNKNSLIKLGEFYPLNSFNTEKVTVFMVEVEKQSVSSFNSEISEQLVEHKYVSFDVALEMIDSGEINDLVSANAIQMAIRKISQT